jgi:hypothetical protein
VRAEVPVGVATELPTVQANEDVDQPVRFNSFTNLSNGKLITLARNRTCSVARSMRSSENPNAVPGQTGTASEVTVKVVAWLGNNRSECSRIQSVRAGKYERL